ncbi:MAG: AAA family ATPase [Bacteroidales bacterium]|jgi:Cdc6-like AAA superfamily ATPase|nr:AAA family ATPase [Bacteroidales bacterium]
MNDIQKTKITTRVREYCDRYESQNRAANSLSGVSAATVSQILNGKWELITDEMWRKLAAQIGFSEDDWVMAETRDFKVITALLCEAQELSAMRRADVFAVTGDAGTGKSAAVQHYVNGHRQAYLVKCSDFWTRKIFLQKIMSALGRDASGMTISDLMETIVSTLKSAERPVLILDEVDKLSDPVLYFFITLYNELEPNCSIFMCATPYLELRISRGRQYNKKGYNEIYSRMGRKCISLYGLSKKDVAVVCMQNGVTRQADIDSVVEDCDSDLRRVKRKVYSLKKNA